MKPRAVTAARLGLRACHVCMLVSQVERKREHVSCPRCGAALHVRKPDSIARTWAFLLAAIVLYIPANLLTMTSAHTLFGDQNDTIMSGVVYLWTAGSWPLAVIVFVASIMVPMLKIMALIFLLVSVKMRSVWQPVQRTRLYRLIELVGRWSMLDIFVIAFLVALVQLRALATIKAGPAAACFGAVVVLTMCATLSFDPRLIWDPVEDDHG
jgi:paraquat-inducible protein A